MKVSLKEGGEFVHRDIRISFANHSLVLENSRLRRVLDLSGSMPRTVSFSDLQTGHDYAASTKEYADFWYAGYNLPTDRSVTEYALESLTAETVPAGFLDGEHVLVRLKIREAVQGLAYQREYFIYPELPFLSTRAGVASETLPYFYWSRRPGLWNDSRYGGALKESCVDSIRLAFAPAHAKAVEFVGRTDYTNDLLFERSCPSGDFNALGNLLYLEADGGHGVMMIAEAPPSSERPDFEAHDFSCRNGEVRAVGWGILPNEISESEPLFSYRTTIGFYPDSEAGRLLLKQYLARRFPQDLRRDFDILVNPWGCGTFNQEVSEAFLLREIAAAAEMGATHYQIDDGWQVGRSLSELTINNRSIDDRFWTIDQRLFPEEFENLKRMADQHGIELALWLAPSSNKEFRDWPRFVDLMMEMYHRYGIRRFKIDGVNVRTKQAAVHFEKMLRTTRELSGGAISFNFDVTNGQRSGYFLFLEYGNIFLENRYACHSWGMVYHPELVLRNLWRLARYVRPQVLQIEFTDPGNVNEEYYRQLNTEPPTAYSPAYWAAVSLFAAPLIWLAPSKIPASLRATFREVLELHRTHREAIFAGEIFPVGSEPDGTAVTGFQSYNPATEDGYLLVYRELKAPECAAVSLWFAENQVFVFESVSDSAAPFTKGAGEKAVSVHLEAPGSFRLYRYRVTS